MAEDTSLRIMDVLTDEQHTALEAMGTPVKFPAEHTIFWEGQPARAVLIIHEGNVKVTRSASDGTEMILAIRGANEIMGDEGVLMNEKRSATVTTITEVIGLDIDGDDLLRFVGDHQLWPVMYRAAVHRGRQSDQRSLLARLDVKSRLARWLLELATEVGEQTEDGWVIATTLSQQDLASRIGASRDAVAIELRRFRTQGLVTTGRYRIVLRDLDALGMIAAG
jgi:CRP/FNR family transcriptional regulator, cyclic AMP receptor protein